MPKIEHSKALQNLAQAQVFINDAVPDSFYFQLRDSDAVLHAGKNAFLIAGTEFLEPTTEVLVEIIDSEGNTVFNQPIKNYAEGLSRVVSIEIYQDTPPGPAMMTILGELRSTVDGTPIPPQFQDAFNVRFQKRLTIDPGQYNNSKVRLYNPPIMSVTESLVPYRIGQSGSLISISSGTVTGISQHATTDSVLGGQNTYAIQFSSPVLSSSMLGASFTASVPTGIFTSSISLILNDTTAYLANSYQSGSFFLPFVTSNYTLSLTTQPFFVATQFTRSFADITIGPLTTFSGEVRRAKIFMKSLDSFGNYEPVADVFIEPTDLMTVNSASTQDPTLHIGNFINQTIFDTYWSGSELGIHNEALPIIISYTTSQLIDAVHPGTQYVFVINSQGAYVVNSNGSYVIVSSGSADPNLLSRVLFDAAIPKQFRKGYEYTFDAAFLCRKSANFTGSVSIYLSGSAFPSNQPFGVLVEKLNVPLGVTRAFFSLDDVAANIIAQNDGTAVVNIIVENGDWYIQNVSVDLANEKGFNPDEVHLLLPITNKRLENLQFKAEIYDVNNNAVPIDIETPPLFFTGENVFVQGTNNRIVGTVTLGTSGSGPTMATDLSGSYIGIGPGQIAKPIDPSILPTYSGSPIITIYSGTMPYTGSTSGSAIGIQIVGASGSATTSFLDFNTLTGRLTIRGDIFLLPNSSLSQSIISGSNTGSAFQMLQQLVSGTLLGGTYLNGNVIIAPLIAGQTGYFSNQFGVGNIAGGQGIILTALGYTASNGSPQSGSPAIYIGQGTFANPNTPFIVASSSFGGILSLGNQFIASQSNGGLTIIISSSNFQLSASQGGNTLLINPTEIALGNPVPLDYTGSGGAIGFFVNKSGQLFLGSGTLDPTSSIGTGSVISFDGQNIAIQTPSFTLTRQGSASIAGTILAQALQVSGAAIFLGPMNAISQSITIRNVFGTKFTSAPFISESSPMSIANITIDQGTETVYGFSPDFTASVPTNTSASIVVGSFALALSGSSGFITTQSNNWSPLGASSIVSFGQPTHTYFSSSVKPAVSLSFGPTAEPSASDNNYSFNGNLDIDATSISATNFLGVRGKVTLEKSTNGGASWGQVDTILEDINDIIGTDLVDNWSYTFVWSGGNVLLRQVYWTDVVAASITAGSAKVSDDSAESKVTWHYTASGGPTVTNRRGILIPDQSATGSDGKSYSIPAFNIQPAKFAVSSSWLAGGDLYAISGSQGTASLFFFNGSQSIKLA